MGLCVGSRGTHEEHLGVCSSTQYAGPELRVPWLLQAQFCCLFLFLKLDTL